MTATLASDRDRNSEPARLSTRPRPPSGRSWNLPRAAVAVLLIVGCGLVSFQLSRSAGKRTPVIAVARDIAPGAVIVREDLRRVEVNADGVATIPVSEADSVIGQLAVGPLPAGSLITRAQLTADPPLAAGRGVLSLPIPQGQVPVGLRPGSLVALLIVDAEVVAATGVERVEATVVDVAEGAGATGITIVSVDVAETDSIPVARAAAGGKVTVMVRSSG